jgi:hypothetical protein
MGFSKPSEAPGGGGIAAYEKALCIFAFKGRGEAETDFGTKAYVEVDIDVVEGAVEIAARLAAPCMSTPTKLGLQPSALQTKAGDSEEGVRIFQGWIKGAFNGQTVGGLVLGRAIVFFEETKQSKTPAPVWKLVDATPQEEAAATAYLTAKAARNLSKPSESPAPAEPAAAPLAAQAGPQF